MLLAKQPPHDGGERRVDRRQTPWPSSQPGAGASGPDARFLATSVAALAVLSTLLAVVVDLRSSAASTLYLSDLVLAASYPVLAAIVLRAQPHNRAGHLLLTTGLLGPYLLAGVYAVDAVTVRGKDHLLVDAATWLAMWGFAPYLVVVALVPLYLPDGRAPGGRWRWYIRSLVVLQVLGLVAAMLTDRSPDVSPELHNPLGIDFAPLHVLLPAAGFGSFVVGAPVALFALVQRFRRTTGTERARHGWLVFGVASLAAFALLSLPFADVLLGDVLLAVGLAIVPLAVGVAVVRHRLFDIEVVLNRAIVYGASTVFVLASYASVVVVVGGIADGTRWALPFTALAALAAAGGRERLQRGVDRLLYGERRDPYAVVARTGDRLEGTRGPLEALSVLAAEVRDVLRVPWVSVVPVDPRLPGATEGATTAHHHFLPLVAHGTQVGELRVGHRHPGERLRRSERAALSEVARRAATLVWSAELVEDLRRSRDEAQRRSEQIVIAREEERRRLRHDLHDGVGPELAGIALQMERLARAVPQPELADRAAALRDQLRSAIVTVRGVVDGLRPPAVDELGLVAALREHALAGDTSGDHAVEVRAAELTGLSAAVQVAAYRIVTEALSNAVRHGHARRTLVELVQEHGTLVVTIVDDGGGIDEAAVAGVGTTSMRERAVELGGSLEIAATQGGGTTVTARIPDGSR